MNKCLIFGKNNFKILIESYWLSCEEKKEKALRNMSLTEDINFNEIFDIRQKLIDFLKSHYEDKKEEVI